MKWGNYWLSLTLVSEKELSTSPKEHAKLPTGGIKNAFHIPSRSAGTKERNNVEEKQCGRNGLHGKFLIKKRRLKLSHY